MDHVAGLAKASRHLTATDNQSASGILNPHTELPAAVCAFLESTRSRKSGPAAQWSRERPSAPMPPGNTACQIVTLAQQRFLTRTSLVKKSDQITARPL